ncbi:hypothetical protein BCR35DRAFT_335687 [Leucosporidium creatinivorum]|uniref:Uncharacterized protein n=1 Tax=Leucosporidium creatinivorum TaxID=106004 RepID=A0A1Y2D6U9_9BASI|nr:hypothetical protein BCR35DRAFT_335687 [Leucosporidium creatinivorum]
MSWLFHRHSRSKSKSSSTSASRTATAPSPSTPASSSARPSSAATTLPASAITSTLVSKPVEGSRGKDKAPSIASVASPSTPNAPSASLDELRTLIADFEADVEPSEGRRIIRKVYEGATDAALNSLDVLSLVPVVSTYVPVIRSVLLIGLLSRTGRSIREACRELATRIARLYELLAKVKGAKADELRELYKEILDAACKLNTDHQISGRVGSLGVLRLGIDSSLVEEIQGLHVKLDRLHTDFTPHVLLGLVNFLSNSTPHAPVSNLGLLQPPPPAPVLLGREQWLETILQSLQSLGAHVVLAGTGGIGKSSLALNALHSPELGLRFQRKLFIRCDTTPSAEALIEELVRVRGQPLAITEEPVGTMVRALEQMSTLLVLDNLETPLDADGSNTKDLVERLAAIPTVSLLITTRQPSISRQPLPRPLHTLVIPELAPAPAKELFLSIAPDFEKDRDLNRLLQHLDGYPLAICLVASRAQDEDSIAEVLKLWQNELEEFDQDGRTRKDSLAISLSLSFSSTAFARQPKAQQLLALLAALPRSLSHSRIHALGLTTGERALLYTSIVKQSRHGSRHSLRLLAPVREYVKRSKDVKLAELSLETKRAVVDSFLDDFARLPKGGAPDVMNPSFREGSTPLDFASNAAAALEFALSLPSTTDEALKGRVEEAVLRLCLRMGYQTRYIGTADDAMRLFEGLDTILDKSSSPVLRLALLLHRAQLGTGPPQDSLALAVLLQQASSLVDDTDLEPLAATKLRAEVHFTVGLLASRLETQDTDSTETAGSPLLHSAVDLFLQLSDARSLRECYYALGLATRGTSSSLQDLQAAADCFTRCELLFPSSVGQAPEGYTGLSSFPSLPSRQHSSVRWTDNSLGSRPLPSYSAPGYATSPPYPSYTQRSGYSLERGELHAFPRGTVTSTMAFSRFRALNAFQLYRLQLSLEADDGRRSRLASRDSRMSDEAYHKAFALLEACGATEWCSFLTAYRLRFREPARQFELLTQETTSPTPSSSVADPVLEAYKTCEIISNPYFLRSWMSEGDESTIHTRAANVTKLDGIHRDFSVEVGMSWANEQARQRHLSASFLPSALASPQPYDMPPLPPRTIAPAQFPPRARPTSPSASSAEGLASTISDDGRARVLEIQREIALEEARQDEDRRRRRAFL